MRVVLATDGSASADRARDLVATLTWPAGTIAARTSRLTTNGSFSCWRRIGYSVVTVVPACSRAALRV